MPLPNFDQRVLRPSAKDAFIKRQMMHIDKAITNQSAPPKHKHIRSIILATFAERSSSFYYEITSKLPLYSNPMLCWKFLYIMNKLIRDGHSECVNDSLRHATKISQIGSSWGNHATKSIYPIEQFCQLISKKIKLHRKYGILPGSFELSSDDVKKALNALPDHLFQFSVDLMDMMEELLKFKDAVLLSLEGSQAAYTSSGQCKLVTLLQCIQDMAALYDLCVHIIFKLHDILGSSTMSGHRERFKALHINIRKFFENASNMHYFRSLLQIPSISQDPPNFTLQSELDEHTRVRVTMMDTGSTSLEHRDNVHSSEEESPQPDVDFQKVFNTNGMKLQLPATSAPFTVLNNATMKEENSAIVPYLSNVPVTNVFEPSQITTLVELDPEDLKSDAAFAYIPQPSDASVKGSTSTTNWNPFLDHLIKSNNSALLQTMQAPELGATTTTKHRAPNQMTTNTDEKYEVLIEVELLKSEIERLKNEHRERSQFYLSRIRTLEDEIKELVQLKDNNEEQATEMETRLNDEVKQLQICNEKFDKLKEIYAKLREEHVLVLRNYANTKDKLHLEMRKNVDLEQRIQVSSLQLHNDSSISTTNNTTENNSPDSHILISLSKQVDKLLMQAFHNTATTNAISNASNESPIDISMVNDHLWAMHYSPAFCLHQFNQCLKHFGHMRSSITLYLQHECDVYELLNNVLAFSIYSCQLFTYYRSTRLIEGCKRDLDDFIGRFAALGETLQSTLKYLSKSKLLLTNDCESNSSFNVKTLQELDSLNKQLLFIQSIIISANVALDEGEESLINEQMKATNEALELAEVKFEKMIKESEHSSNKEKLRLNHVLLNSCSELLLHVKKLVREARTIQQEIMLSSSMPTEFYRPQSRWKDGFLSAAKYVGATANSLIETADAMLSNDMCDTSKPEKLLIISQEIAASTTQLVLFTRIKSNTDSLHYFNLQTISKDVTRVAGEVVAAVKGIIEAKHKQELDFSCLTLTQTKRMDVELQVKIIQLETQLADERQRLAQLRKESYQESAEVELQIDALQTPNGDSS